MTLCQSRAGSSTKYLARYLSIQYTELLAIEGVGFRSRPRLTSMTDVHD